MFADCHCHLNHPSFRDRLPAVLAAAEKAEVTRIIVAGWDEESSRYAVELAVKYPQISAAVGLHPWYITEQNILAWLPALLDSPQVVAIGEIGLDATRHASAPLTLQRDIFQQQLQLATERVLPVVIHCVHKWAALLESLKHCPGTRGLLHAYSGSREVLQELIAQGISVSFGAGILNPELNRMQSALLATPAEAMLLESDAPFAQLPGDPQRYLEPAQIPLLLAKAAQLRGEAAGDLAKQLARNINLLFAG